MFVGRERPFLAILTAPERRSIAGEREIEKFKRTGSRREFQPRDGFKGAVGAEKEGGPRERGKEGGSIAEQR